MIYLIILISILLHYSIGFASIYVSLKMDLGTLDREDHVFCSIMALFGIIVSVILITNAFSDWQKFKSVIKEIVKRPPPKKLTLKQMRLKKLKRLNRFKWIRI